MKTLLWIAWSLLLATVPQLDARKIPRWWLRVAQKQGPNACVVEEVPGTNLEFWTECRYWLSRNICGRKTRMRFECCEGFEQIEGVDGCARVKPLKNLLETAEDLGATKWAQYIRDSGRAPELESSGAFTLFAPTNEAFESVDRALKSQLESYRGQPDNAILLYHIVPTKLPSDVFRGNMVVESKYPGHNIRINKYSNGMTTINCALLIRKDQQATNGIVHLIDGVLNPSTGVSQNVADMLINDGRFTVLADMLEKSGYVTVLRTMPDAITILAPSDEAFQKIPESRREKIINDREARLALIQNHVIPHVICESAITGEHKVRTVSHNKLKFNCDLLGAYVESTKLRGNFNLGKNGIVHMIDDVLLPDRAKNLLELAESHHLYTFVELVKKAGLEETLSHTGDYTFFVPDELAWQSLDSEVKEAARRDLEYAGQLIRYHGAYGRHLTNAITDNQAIISLDEENPVRLQVWRRAVGVEDAKITQADLEAQNGVIHIINKVIVPSNQTAGDILRSIRGQSFRMFLDAMEKVTKQTPPVLNLGPGDETFYTFFVPTDEAFRALDQKYVQRMMSDTNYLTEVVKTHIAVNMFPGTSFEDNLIYSIEGMESTFDIRKTKEGMTVNGAKVSSSHMSANGVIHIIDRVFVPNEHYTYSYSKTISTTSTGGNSSSTTSTSRTTTRRTYETVTYLEKPYVEGGSVLPEYPQGTAASTGAKRKLVKNRRRLSRRRGTSRKSKPSSSPSVTPNRSYSSTPRNARKPSPTTTTTTTTENPSTFQETSFKTAEVSLETKTSDNTDDDHRSLSGSRDAPTGDQNSDTYGSSYSSTQTETHQNFSSSSSSSRNPSLPATHVLSSSTGGYHDEGRSSWSDSREHTSYGESVSTSSGQDKPSSSDRDEPSISEVDESSYDRHGSSSYGRDSTQSERGRTAYDETRSSSYDTTEPSLYGRTESSPYERTELSPSDRTEPSSYDRTESSSFDRTEPSSSYDRSESSSYDGAGSSHGRTEFSSYDRAESSSYGRTGSSSYGRSEVSRYDEIGSSTHGESTVDSSDLNGLTSPERDALSTADRDEPSSSDRDRSDRDRSYSERERNSTYDGSRFSSYGRTESSLYDRTESSPYDTTGSSYDRNETSTYDRTRYSSYDRTGLASGRSESSYDRTGFSSYDRRRYPYDRRGSSSYGYNRTTHERTDPSSYDRTGFSLYNGTAHSYGRTSYGIDRSTSSERYPSIEKETSSSDRVTSSTSVDRSPSVHDDKHSSVYDSTGFSSHFSSSYNSSGVSSPNSRGYASSATNAESSYPYGETYDHSSRVSSNRTLSSSTYPRHNVFSTLSGDRDSDNVVGSHRDWQGGSGNRTSSSSSSSRSNTVITTIIRRPGTTYTESAFESPDLSSSITNTHKQEDRAFSTSHSSSVPTSRPDDYNIGFSGETSSSSTGRSSGTGRINFRVSDRRTTNADTRGESSYGDGSNSVSSNRRTHTYTFTSQGDGSAGFRDSVLHGSSNLPNEKSTKVTTTTSKHHHNTLGPLPAPTNRINYIGHAYGNDAIGGSRSHIPLPSSSLPVSSSFSSSSYSSSGQFGAVRSSEGGDDHSHITYMGQQQGPGVHDQAGKNRVSSSSSTKTTRRYGVRRTVYTYPSRGTTHSSRTTRTFIPGTVPVPTTDHDGKKSSTLVSAYAFTGADDDFADGTEFAEAVGTPEEEVKSDSAELRRRWRRKRHQLRAGKKGRRQGRRLRRRRRGRKHARKMAAKKN